MNQDFLAQWQQLKEIARNESVKDLQALFNQSPNRAASLSFEVEDVFVDFSKNWITPEILHSLIKLADASQLSEKITHLFTGHNINVTENKPATHTLQRQTKPPAQMTKDRNKMFEVARNYSSGQWLTAFDKCVETVVNIGIGGSYLGPKIAIQALTDLQMKSKVKVLYFASIDDVRLQSIISTTDIERTLFCVSSKSLGTIETLKNANAIKELLEKKNNYQPNKTNQSFVIATTNNKKAGEFGVPESHVLPFDNATGGRFSVWSSIGFPLLMAIGEKGFLSFLAGAEKMDKHFKEADFNQNLPVLMAMISIWYRNFMHLTAYAVIPYDANLKHLPAWLQQLMMESNGKMHDVNGEEVSVSTSPWLFGDHGQLSQHAFFQAFHQSKDVLPIDFIGVLGPQTESKKYLLINMLAQSAALMNGSDHDEKQFNCPGNRPSTTILLKELTPSSLGQLLAMYEHMIYVQSVIWNINCFDQPGVELGKTIARNIVEHIQDDTLEEVHLDKSTQQLLAKVLEHE
jgi:glucose-6-phosphate isomerase